MALRDHQPIVLDEFNGLYSRGGPDQTPLDHFSECENIKFTGTSGFATRDGVEPHQNVATPLANIVRIYNYPTQTANTLLVLTTDGDIFHVVDSTTVFGPILSIPAMADFGFAPYAGRAYITPFKSYTAQPTDIEKGLQSDFLYVYKGDGTAARKAAGNPPTAGTLTIANGTGFTDAGFHLFGVAYETDTGFITAPDRFTGFTTSASNGVSFSNIPVSPDSFVVARRLVMTKVITNYNGDTTGYQYFFIPDGRIADNTTTVLNNITVFDADLLEDASHLIDNFAEIPAGVGLSFYHNRLMLHTTFNDPSVVYVSAPGEPEAIDQITGLLIVPLDGNPITNGHELRDVYYAFKRNRTVSYVDNGDNPSTWPMTFIDYGIGCGVHGIGTVVDSGSSDVDYLTVGSYSGLMLFNGKYIRPELTWKIRDFWLDQDPLLWRRMQILNDSVQQFIYIVLPDGRVLYGDYTNGLDPKKIRWAPWLFDINVRTAALVNTSTLILGSDHAFV